MLTLKLKIIIGLVLAAILTATGLYINHLHHKVDNLKEDKIELTTQVKSGEAAIEEDGRRKIVVDVVTHAGDEERAKIEKEYQEKIEKVDNNVKQGKDKPVGPVLSEFFN